MYILFTPVKYPVIDIVTDEKGKLIAIIYSTMLDILSCNIYLHIIGESAIKSIHAILPKNKLYSIHFCIAILAPDSEFIDNSSATILVDAKLIPELAIVIANIYTDIISPNSPIDSLPILLATYMSKNIEQELIINEVTINITVLNKKICIFFNYLSPFLYKKSI